MVVSAVGGRSVKVVSEAVVGVVSPLVSEAVSEAVVVSREPPDPERERGASPLMSE